jgi:hypothetical protein
MELPAAVTVPRVAGRESESDSRIRAVGRILRRPVMPPMAIVGPIENATLRHGGRSRSSRSRGEARWLHPMLSSGEWSPFSSSGRGGRGSPPEPADAVAIRARADTEAHAPGGTRAAAANRPCCADVRDPHAEDGSGPPPGDAPSADPARGAPRSRCPSATSNERSPSSWSERQEPTVPARLGDALLCRFDRSAPSIERHSAGVSANDPA